MRSIQGTDGDYTGQRVSPNLYSTTITALAARVPPGDFSLGQVAYVGHGIHTLAGDAAFGPIGLATADGTAFYGT